MEMNTNHMSSLDAEMTWLESVLHDSFESYFGELSPELKTPPQLGHLQDSFAQLINEHNLNIYERLMLALVLAPHVKPQLLDLFFTKNSTFDRGFTEFGGYVGKYHGGFLPTAETLVFVLSMFVNNCREKTRYLMLNSVLVKEGVVVLTKSNQDEPFWSTPIHLNTRFLDYFMSGHLPDMESSNVFPAQKISTNLDWSDLVIDPEVFGDLDQIRCWIEKEDYLMTDLGLGKKIKPGFKCLFYGPPGTGKSLSATLLGKSTCRDVYRVDLSLIVSKYIGETEKNLAKILDAAEHQKWILFFDEADALFGKRTSTNSSNDRFANQEVSYLLQRVEDYPGVVILASNLKSNIDEAFTRRFHSIVYFGMPDATSRKKLWEGMFEDTMRLDPDIDFAQIAEKFELSGGSAVNVLRYSTLESVRKGASQISRSDLMAGIRKEYGKIGKTINHK